MRLPRWLGIALWSTSVLAVFTAAGWWWITWPERTLRSYVELVDKGRDPFALLGAGMVKAMELEKQSTTRGLIPDVDDFELAFEPRSLRNVIIGRLVATQTWNDERAVYITAERGVIADIGFRFAGRSEYDLRWSAVDEAERISGSQEAMRKAIQSFRKRTTGSDQPGEMFGDQ